MNSDVAYIIHVINKRKCFALLGTPRIMKGVSWFLNIADNDIES